MVFFGGEERYNISSISGTCKKIKILKTLPQSTCSRVSKALLFFFFILSFIMSRSVWENAFLVKSEVLGLLVNTLLANNDYCCHNIENLPLPIQMQLSKKPKTFCFNFITSLKSRLNPEHFYKRHEPHRWNISKMIDSEKRGNWNRY